MKLERINVMEKMERLEVSYHGTIRITNIDFEGKEVQTEFYLESDRMVDKLIEELKTLKSKK